MKATHKIIKLIHDTPNDADLGKAVRSLFKDQELSAGELRFYPHIGIWYKTDTKETGMMRGKME